MKSGIWIGLCVLLLLLVSATAKEKWLTFSLRDCCQQLYSSSSELNAPEDQTKPGKYGAQNLFDGSPETCWAEGKTGSGIGQNILVALQEIPDKIKVVNGYGKSPALFQKNNRINEMALVCYGAFTIEGHATELATDFEALQLPIEKTVKLADSLEKQEIIFPFHREELQNFLNKAEFEFFQRHKSLVSEKVQRFLVVSCKIKSVYRGSKWNDTCLSELSFHIPRRHVEKTISAVKTNKQENTVFLERIDGTRDILIKDTGSVFQIMDISQDKAWVILIQMPAHPGPGRVATHYLLYHTGSKKKILPDPAHPDIGDIYGFETENHTLFLQYENIKTGDILLLKLTELQKKPGKSQVKVGVK